MEGLSTIGLTNPALPVIGNPNSTEDPKIQGAFSAILATLNGNIDSANLADAAVGNAELQTNAVTGAKIADSTINSSKILDGTLVTTDLATSTLNTWLKLVTGADRKINFGSGTAGFNSAGTLNVNVTHGLGVVPIFAAGVVVSGGNVTGGISNPVQLTPANNVVFNMYFQAINGVTFDGASFCAFQWVAIG